MGRQPEQIGNDPLPSALRFLTHALRPALVFLGLCFLAIFFRTYSIHDGLFFLFRSSEGLAISVVDRAMEEQIIKDFGGEFQKLTSAEREELIGKRLGRLKRESPEQYAIAVQSVKRNIERLRRDKQPLKYLLEADPYHYFYQANRLIETGSTGDMVKAGKVRQPLGRAPYGSWEPLGFHPHVGVALFRTWRFFAPKISLVEALAWVPVLLTCLVVLFLLVFFRAMGLGMGSGVVGVLAVILSPIYIQRSSLGWFDTDPYHYLFPLSVLSCILGGLRVRGKRMTVLAVLAAALTVFYYYFWNGWSFLFFLAVGCLAMSGLLLAFLKRPAMPDIARDSFRFLMIYLATALVSFWVFLTPQGLWKSVCGAWAALNQFFLADFDLWPNVFLTVGEASGVSLQKMIFLVGNPITCGVAVLGFLGEVWGSFRRNDLSRQFRVIFLTLFSIPLFFLAFKTERFGVLAVLPTAIFCGFAFSNMLDACDAVRKKGKAKAWLRLIFSRAFLTGAFLLFFLPMPLVMAHIVATGVRPIMDDVWYEALTELREKTPENAIVDSWWPPGYFVIAIANRRVIMDGGTQQYHQTYWMAKALFSADEKESAGILRMLNVSGDAAFEFLDKLGMETPDAVDLILSIVRMGRQEALLRLPSWMTDGQKNELLEKTHGAGEVPPSYVLLYDDLVTQNLAASTIAQWDFRKAQALRARKRGGVQAGSGIFQKSATSRYVRELMQVAGEFLKYQPAAPLKDRKGDILVFDNGAIVNLAIKDAVLPLPSRGGGRPRSLFYIERGQLVEKEFDGERLNVSVLIFEDAGVFYSVIADPRLIRSLLFRLYYLDGQGLSFFKPLIRKGSLSGGTVVRVFEMDRTRFLEGERVER